MPNKLKNITSYYIKCYFFYLNYWNGLNIPKYNSAN